ncbi:hypothetical protein BG454_14820 [Roseinatronobacter bogoriensis subsp. barguzinensis]|uniref:Uncharacterized protein n=1 Tax=Roseinatronobacter bogoriensis subsp. barguzinensis TaxID=441209 RepID=A0A2K8KBX4_9RHOB|nr:hypothetical protein BG454_14820 [Rhodobaca barguzinensis]
MVGYLANWKKDAGAKAGPALWARQSAGTLIRWMIRSPNMSRVIGAMMQRVHRARATLQRRARAPRTML